MKNKLRLFGSSCLVLAVIFVGFGCELPGTGSSDNSSTTTTAASEENAGYDTSGLIGQINVTVGPGTKPQFSWTGGAIAILSVHRKMSDDPSWEIGSCSSDYTIFSNGILSPVVYGSIPSGIIQTEINELTLTPGVQYEVTVIRVSPNSKPSQPGVMIKSEAIGSMVFVP